MKRRRQPIRPNMDTSSVDLAEELIELILSKSPLKSVVRFKSVSKSWKSIISSRRFSRIHHIQRSKLPENRNRLLILAAPENRWRHQLYMIGLKDGKFQREERSRKPPKKFIRRSKDVCSCDGLILIRKSVTGEYVLWNPFIRKHCIISKTKSKYYIPWNSGHSHLYYDSVTEEYKIVIAYRDWYAVFSCRSGSWGEKKDFPRDRIRSGEEASVDGCIYGIQRDDGGILSIICFDVRDGRVHEFPKPKGVEGLVHIQLDVVSGRLCLYGFTKDGGGLRLWVMAINNGCRSWRKLISTKTKRILSDIYYHTKPVCLSNEDHVVLGSEKADKYKHFIYNSRQKRWRKTKFTWKISQYYFPYQENLYLMP